MNLMGRMAWDKLSEAIRAKRLIVARKQPFAVFLPQGGVNIIRKFRIINQCVLAVDVAGRARLSSSEILDTCEI